MSAFCAAVSVLDPENGQLYNDYARSLFSDAARKLLEETVKLENYEWQSDFAREHIAVGEAKMLLRWLRMSKICVSAEARERIMNCTDPEQLERWADRVPAISTVDELFA
ncbi:hypothetical protein ACFQ07_27960 [Actinomadura adrarensis]|uniref:Uncharacterized protein n=1 Tax=Actinomadura adrarensis TaxID=1819600 RepID=A0ABW3CP07_9ACTN